jgi:hypothetical protein
MKKIWDYINNILLTFRSCFSREAAFDWFLVIVVGLMLRGDHLGVTSIVRELSLDNALYECMMHFFRSTAWTLSEIRNHWIKIVAGSGQMYEVMDKLLFIGDGVKNTKEGRKMPGVKRLHQESEDTSKPSYIFGHLWGCLGIVTGNSKKLFSLPISMTIQDGVRPILEWTKSEYSKDSHVTRLVREACKAAELIRREAFLLMDRCFLTEPALKTIAAEPGGKLITLVTRVKSNAVAYEDHPPARKPGRGRPPSRKERVPLMDLFQSMRESFVTIKLELYGKVETVKYLCVDKLWGDEQNLRLRFVLAEIDGAKTILACNSLTIPPEQIIVLYGFRFKIETFFRAFKQTIDGLGYHFWTSIMPKLNRFGSAAAYMDSLKKITRKKDQEKIISAYNATEGFVMFACIAIGLLQLCSLKFASEIIDSPWRWLRTRTSTFPSEETAADCLRKTMPKIFENCRDLAIIQKIKAKTIDHKYIFDETA